mgnify:CR=1 FL=1
MDKVNLIDNAAIEKMRELAGRAQVGFFQTYLKHAPSHGRPMVAVKVDDAGRFWFFSKNNSRKNHEIRLSNKVQLIFSRPHSLEFLEVYGEARIVRDEKKMKELWTPSLRNWIPGGIEEPDTTLICVKPIEAHYWDTKHNTAVLLFKGVLGALTGITMNGDIEGKLKIK